MTKTMIWSADTDTFMLVDIDDRVEAVREIRERLREDSPSPRDVERQRELSRLRWSAPASA